GFRADGNNYNNQMANLFNQFSPRFSASFDLSEKWSLNFNTGRYFQLPAYTVLGYRENNVLVNKNNGVTYIKSDHIVGGIEFRPNISSRITVEGFNKLYANYPTSTTTGISLANLGADFGVIGNESITSTSKGRAYGLEFLYQRKITKGFYGIFAYTLVRSEFKNGNG